MAKFWFMSPRAAASKLPWLRIEPIPGDRAAAAVLTFRAEYRVAATPINAGQLVTADDDGRVSGLVLAPVREVPPCRACGERSSPGVVAERLLPAIPFPICLPCLRDLRAYCESFDGIYPDRVARWLSLIGR